MLLLCTIGLHSWRQTCICECCAKVRDKGHRWNGCLCTRCRSERDEDHSWEQCLCTRCGKHHNWKESFEVVGYGAPMGYASDVSGGFHAAEEIHKRIRRCEFCAAEEVLD